MVWDSPVDVLQAQRAQLRRPQTGVEEDEKDGPCPRRIDATQPPAPKRLQDELQLLRPVVGLNSLRDLRRLDRRQRVLPHLPFLEEPLVDGVHASIARVHGRGLVAALSEGDEPLSEVFRRRLRQRGEPALLEEGEQLVHRVGVALDGAG